ncbi:MAG: SOS response-associated peptidase, partial [Phycisphaerae bacterium]|nr:SOS response-associated peptidase [Saprospiraceae bacterium]
EWGLVPFWSKDGKNTGKLINARAEGITERPMFREPIKSRRCLVPADSFYEWHKTDEGKEPYRITMKNGEMIYMAGIWEKWRHEGTIKRTFSIITTAPNSEMSTLHDRMPVILDTAEAQQLWLSDLPLSDILSLLHAPADGTLSMYRISTKVNKPGNNGEDLHDPVPDTTAQV